MINLLPSQQKELLRQEKNCRMVFSIVFLLSIFLISFCLILFFTKETVARELGKKEESLKQKIEGTKISQIDSFEKQSAEYMSSMNKIKTFYSGVINMTGLLKDISDTMPYGTYLTNITFKQKIDKEKQTINSISIFGFASRRENLIDLKKRLEEKGIFKNIDFPSSNWVKPEDVSFTASFEL